MEQAVRAASTITMSKHPRGQEKQSAPHPSTHSERPRAYHACGVLTSRSKEEMKFGITAAPRGTFKKHLAFNALRVSRSAAKTRRQCAFEKLVDTVQMQG